MQATCDSFVMFLTTNLGEKVHYVHFDKNNPTASELQMGAVNIEFETAELRAGRPSSQDVFFDILTDNEGDARTLASKVVTLLQGVQSLPKLDYSDPDNPVPTGTQLFWDADISFSPVNDESYFHFTALLTINHVFLTQS